MSETKVTVDEELLESVVELAIRLLDFVPKLAERDRQAGQDVDPAVEVAMSHLALRTAADFLERGIFPAGLDPRIRAVTEAATHRLAAEFATSQERHGAIFRPVPLPC